MAIVEKISKLFGGLVGSLLTEKSLAIWIYCGRPALAFVWAIGRYLINGGMKKLQAKGA